MIDGINQPADTGGDIVELLAQIGFLEPLAFPVRHDRRLDVADLGAQAFEFFFH
ncbi:hypothetical protein D3C72_2296730 [compost metagenome]